MELNKTLSTVFRPGAPRLELFETNESDIVQAHDYIIPLPNLDSKGLRVKVIWETPSICYGGQSSQPRNSNF